jgi:hypothetical protein
MSGALKWVQGIIPDNANREKDDFYQTPRAGTLALLSVEDFDGAIWEPACGDGAISEVLKERGHDVFSSDLVDRGYGLYNVDFLMEYRFWAPNIVSNPPFKLAVPFIEKALDLTTGKVAFLFRLAFLEGMERRKLFESTPLKNVWVFSKRLAVHRAGDARNSLAGGMIAFAWFVWEHGYEGRPLLGWIEPDVTGNGKEDGEGECSHD